METVVKLDPDVEELLRTEARSRNLDFDRVLNEAIRAGFAGDGSRFVQKTYSMGAMDDPKRFLLSSMNWTTSNVEENAASGDQVIVPDVNLLVYAINSDDPRNEKAMAWLNRALVGTESVGFAWSVLTGFLRITTRPSAGNALTVEQAFEVMSTWLTARNARIIQPGPRHRQLLQTLLNATGVGGNLVSDAHVAAIAIEHDAELLSNDADFSRFPGLRWRNPIAE